jgi:type IV secretory pathway VirB6-like protein
MLVMVTALAASPESLHASGIATLHASSPAMQHLSADAIRAVLTPAPAAADLCFGPIKPSGERAQVLAFDRHLSAAMWLDRNGRPTFAPNGFTKSDVMIIGNVPDATTPTHVTYLFAEAQAPSAHQRTLELLQDKLSGVDLKRVEATGRVHTRGRRSVSAARYGRADRVGGEDDRHARDQRGGVAGRVTTADGRAAGRRESDRRHTP